jgi:hypothetical protein
VGGAFFVRGRTGHPSKKYNKKTPPQKEAFAAALSVHQSMNTAEKEKKISR